MEKPAVRQINTTVGKRWITGRIVDGSFRVNHYAKDYKRKSSAMKAAKKYI